MGIINLLEAKILSKTNQVERSLYMEIEKGTAIDALPSLPVSLDSFWDHADKKRDNVAAMINAELKKQNISAWIKKSQPGEYPLYVVVDSWIQKGETPSSVFLDRSSLQVTISVDPCRVHPYTYKVELNRQGQAFNREHWELDDN